MLDIQLYQKSWSFYNHDHPNINALKAIIKNSDHGYHAMTKVTYADQKKGTIANAYDQLVLCLIFDQFWQQNFSNKPVVVEGNL